MALSKYIKWFLLAHGCFDNAVIGDLADAFDAFSSDNILGPLDSGGH